MAKRRTGLVNYYWGDETRPIDLVTRFAMAIRVLEVFDSIDILRDEDNVPVGQILWVTGPRFLVRFLDKFSDYGHAIRKKVRTKPVQIIVTGNNKIYWEE